jgi:hypothetical protein
MQSIDYKIVTSPARLLSFIDEVGIVRADRERLLRAEQRRSLAERGWCWLAQVSGEGAATDMILDSYAQRLAQALELPDGSWQIGPLAQGLHALRLTSAVDGMAPGELPEPSVALMWLALNVRGAEEPLVREQYQLDAAGRAAFWRAVDAADGDTFDREHMQTRINALRCADEGVELEVAVHTITADQLHRDMVEAEMAVPFARAWLARQQSEAAG